MRRTPGASKQHVPSSLFEQDSAPLVPHPELTLLKMSIGPRAGEYRLNGPAETRAAREPRTTSEATILAVRLVWKGNEEGKGEGRSSY